MTSRAPNGPNPSEHVRCVLSHAGSAKGRIAMHSDTSPILAVCTDALGDAGAMLRFSFNPGALEAFAKELRRASWGIAVAAVAGGIKATDWAPSWLIIGGAAVWLVLQCTAVALESLNDDKDQK